MSLLDAFMPSCELREVDHVAVRASPEAAWSAVRAIDFSRTSFVRNLFAIRVMPGRIRARLRGAPSPELPASTIDDIARDGGTFCILGEEPGQEIVVGAVGKVWPHRIEFAAITQETFASFATPGFGKVAGSLAVAPRPGGAWITIEVRAATTDPETRARYRRYWRAVRRFSRAMRKAVGTLLAEELGPEGPDERWALAGDDFLPAARAQMTHHVDIEAPPAEVWPWLVQMGRRRGGWYSWDLLDNGGAPSADRIIPALQKLARRVRRGIRPFVDEYHLAGGRRVYLLADGRLINLAAAEGHPACVMDMSFAVQALSAEHVAKLAGRGKLARKVHDVPAAVDKFVAALKLKSMGVSIDRLTPEQKKYLASWEMGT